MAHAPFDVIGQDTSPSSGLRLLHVSATQWAVCAEPALKRVMRRRGRDFDVMNARTRPATRSLLRLGRVIERMHGTCELGPRSTLLVYPALNSRSVLLGVGSDLSQRGQGAGERTHEEFNSSRHRCCWLSWLTPD